MEKRRILPCCIFGAVLFALVLAPSVLGSGDEPFATFYFSSFKEGEKVTPTFNELDILIFTYYGENYTSRVLSVTSETSMIRVETKAVEISLEETYSFDLDGDDLGDLNITLVDTDSDTATFTMILLEKPEEEEEDDVQNITNTTSNNSTNITTNQTNSTLQDNNITNNNSSINNSLDATNTTNATQNNETGLEGNSNGNNSRSENSSSAKGGPVVINLNINVTPGAGIGFIIVISVVLGGLFIYFKMRGEAIQEVQKTQKISKTRKAAGKTGKTSKNKSALDLAYKKLKPKLRKFNKKFKKHFKKARIKIGKAIAGRELDKK